MTKSRIKTIAPGKVILFGERALENKKKGLVTAINLYTRVTLEPATDISIFSQRDNKGIGIDFSTFRSIYKNIRDHDLDRYKNIDQLRTEEHWNFYPHLYLAGHAMQLNGKDKKGFSAVIESDVPKSLGSSSSSFAALALALYNYYCSEQPYYSAQYYRPTVEKLTNIADTLAHGGRASGIDGYASTWGGTGYFDEEKNAGGIGYKDATPFTLLVIDSNEPAKPFQTTKDIEKRRKRDPDYINGIIRELTKITHEGRDAYRNNNYEQFTDAIDKHYATLQRLGTTTPTLDKIVTLAKEQGLHAKPTGSWGAGHCIAPLPPNDTTPIATYELFFKQQGYNAFPVTTNAEGARREE